MASNMGMHYHQKPLYTHAESILTSREGVPLPIAVYSSKMMLRGIQPQKRKLSKSEFTWDRGSVVRRIASEIQ